MEGTKLPSERPPRGDLNQFAAFEGDRYAGIDHDRLVAYVVKLLDERRIRTTFEHITVAAYRLFPNVFALEGFPEYPDAARVNRTLLHGGPKYRDYLTGRATTGYSLSIRGETAAKETAEMVSGSAGPRRHRGRAKAPRAFYERIEREVRTSDAFKSWHAKATVEIEDFYLFLHLLPGSTKAAVRENLKAIRSQLEDSKAEDIASFLGFIEQHFKEEIN
jgi:hypothetical protein